MNKLFLALLSTFVVLTAYAAKSNGALHTFTQPDGTQISVCLLGDEYFSWYQTSDGVLLIREDNVFYIAKTDSQGQLLNTGIIAHNAEVRTRQEEEAAAEQHKAAYLRRSEDAHKGLSQRKAIDGYPKSYFCPHSGTVRVPIILVEYPDMALTFREKSDWEEHFNGTTRTPYSLRNPYQGYSSIKQYFLDASNGKLNFEFDIYGPYTVTNNHDWYGISGNRFVLCTEAIDLACQDIDFAQYDSDDDGRVDMVYVLYAGEGANLSGDNRDVWPCCFSTPMSFGTISGKQLNVLGCANELIWAPTALGNCRAGIGITCHEMSHGMGLPDLYWTLNDEPPTDSLGYIDYNNCGPGDWDLMDGGETLFNAIWPCQYTAWEQDVMGWIEVEELTEPATVTLFPLNKEGGKAYRVTNPANKNEYYIIENYQRDEWNRYINLEYGSGLLITHLNVPEEGFNLTPNNTYGKPNITIIPADGYLLSWYSSGHTFNYRGDIVTMPTSNEVDENGNPTHNWSDYYLGEMLGDLYAGTYYYRDKITSLAAYNNYAGEEMVAKYPITDISHNSDGSMTFNFMGGTTTDIAVSSTTEAETSAIYNVEGVFVGTTVSTLPHGLYIRNGRKFVR